MRAAAIKLVLAGGLLAALAAAQLVGQEAGVAPAIADRGAAPPPGEVQKFKYRTAADCLRCHEEPSPVDLRQGVTDRIHMTEGSVWSEQDKHSQAYAVLENGRSQRMGKLLGKNVLFQETGCVACHTTNIDDTAWLEQHAAAIDQGRSEGVACESCHGASSEWYDMHTLGSWRELTDQQKASHGFTQLKDPVVRAEVCLSCHIGDAKRGRVITHEMYAAGHPPLSGFEPESAADRMPRHWRYAYEKPGAAAEDDPYVRARYALVASIVGMRMAVDLAAGEDSGARPWPELARLDCYDCHHELQADSWRQHRPGGARAGRAELELGSVSLLAIAVWAVDGKDGENELQAAIERLRRPFEKNVFGDAEQLRAAAPEVVAWCRGVEESLRTYELHGMRGLEVINGFFNIGDHDYDSARQSGGAASLIFAGFERSRQLARPEVAAALDALAEELDLKDDGRPNVEESGFIQQMERRVRYRPEELRERMKALVDVLAD